MTDPTLADRTVSFVNLIGTLASVGSRAQPILDEIAPWVPLPYFNAAVHVLDVAAPYLSKIAAAAPGVSQAVDQQGRPILDAIQAHGPGLLDALKHVYAAAANSDPLRAVGSPSIAPSDVTDEQVYHFAGPALVGRRWTDDETQRWWNIAQGQS